MRKRLNENDKRSVIIGIKVRPDIKAKIQYLSEAEDEGMSTYINRILENHIRNRTKFENIKWEDIIKERCNESE